MSDWRVLLCGLSYLQCSRKCAVLTIPKSVLLAIESTIAKKLSIDYPKASHFVRISDQRLIKEHGLSFLIDLFSRSGWTVYSGKQVLYDF